MPKPAVNSRKESARPAGRRSPWRLPSRRLRSTRRRRPRTGWVAGVSIGAINAAIIAGNPADKRVERLREFWELVSSRLTLPPLAFDDASRKLFNETSAALVASTGAPGFFEPRYPPAIVMPPGTVKPSASTTRAHCGHASRTRGFRSFEFWTNPSQRRSRRRRQRKSQIFRQHDRQDRSRTHHGERRTAAGIPARRDRRSRSIGTAVSSRTRRCSMCSTAKRRAQTCAFSKSICSAPKAPFQKHFSTFKSARRRSVTQAARASIPMSQAKCRRCAASFAGLKKNCPTRSRPASTGDFWLRSAATPPSRSSTSFTGVPPTPHNPTTTNSRATPLTSTGGDGHDDVERTLSKPAWKSRERPTAGVTVLDLTKELEPDRSEHRK